MAIEVTCPNGHVLKVKDKYAGKTGCCPHCNSRVDVPEPAKVSEDDILEFVGPAKPAGMDDDDEHVYQDPAEEVSSANSGASLLGSSAIRHMKACSVCGEKVPVWHASCPQCDTYFDDM